MTRQELFDIMHDRLGVLATEAGLTSNEASYGNCLDAALRALNVTIADDLTNALLDVFEQFTLKKLRNFYTFYVDSTLGPRSEKLKQILQAIEKRIVNEVVVVNNTPSLGTVIEPDADAPINWWELWDYPL